MLLIMLNGLSNLYDIHKKVICIEKGHVRSDDILVKKITIPFHKFLKVTSCDLQWPMNMNNLCLILNKTDR